jgi:hypothetical protein
LSLGLSKEITCRENLKKARKESIFRVLNISLHLLGEIVLSIFFSLRTLQEYRVLHCVEEHAP